MMFNWKKLIMGAAVGAFCLGLSYAAPGYANSVVQVSNKKRSGGVAAVKLCQIARNTHDAS